MRRARIFPIALVMPGTAAAGTALAGQWPYIMTFYDGAGNAAGWRVGACNGTVHYSGERTDEYTIERLQCPD
jgi:hypothetical protein